MAVVPRDVMLRSASVCGTAEILCACLGFTPDPQELLVIYLWEQLVIRDRYRDQLQSMRILINKKSEYDLFFGSCLMDLRVQRSAGPPEQGAALERTWDMTKASAGQKVGAVALGLVNVVGITVLTSLLANPVNQYRLAMSSLGFVGGALPLLQVCSAGLDAVALRSMCSCLFDGMESQPRSAREVGYVLTKKDYVREYEITRLPYCLSEAQGKLLRWKGRFAVREEQRRHWDPIMNMVARGLPEILGIVLMLALDCPAHARCLTL